MNMYIFAESLTLVEVNELSNILYDLKVKHAKNNIVALSIDEVLCVNHGYKIAAIKLYRERTGGSLLDAKVAVDSYVDLMR